MSAGVAGDVLSVIGGVVVTGGQEQQVLLIRGQLCWPHGDIEVNGSRLNAGCWYSINWGGSIYLESNVPHMFNDIDMSNVSREDATTYAAQIAAIFSTEPHKINLGPGVAERAAGKWRQVFFGVDSDFFEWLLTSFHDVNSRVNDTPHRRWLIEGNHYTATTSDNIKETG